MTVASAVLQFRIHDAQSLKDKRMVARSLMDSARRKFNASIAEVDTQDVHQLLTLGVAVVSGEASHANEMLEHVLCYLENRAGADLLWIERDP